MKEPQANPLRVLILEDRPEDAELLVHRLERAQISTECVYAATEAEFVEVLGNRPVDLVLADYSLPQYNALEALKELQRRDLDIPFIVVTGSLGEEKAVECMRAGATDYLLKDRLARLGPAVTRAMESKAARDHETNLQDQLRQSQKLEAVGLLAGGIAHDFNNILTVIRGYADFIQNKERRGSASHVHAAEIIKSQNRASALTRQLLAFARRQVEEPRTLALNALIWETHDFFVRLMGERVHLDLDLSATELFVHIDPHQLEQVIMNLVVNARDAMSDGGRLTLSTAAVGASDVTELGVGATGSVSHVRLSVTDTGSGIPPERLDQIFDPFFTTKPRGKGTGLGLSTVYGIVQQAGGRIDVHSEVGHGTTFHIELPAAEPEETWLEPDEPSQQPLSLSGTVLLAEDDAPVRRLVARMLERSGFDVVEARDGEHALRLAQEDLDEFSLVVTDLMMPGMTGAELAMRLRDLRQDLPFLYVSGYRDEAVDLSRLPQQRAGFLAKPFTGEELARAASRLLGTPEGDR